MAVVVGGCSSKPEAEPTDLYIGPERVENEQIVNMSFEEQARAGAITSRTIYPHHFLPDAPELTLVGQRRFDAMTTHAPGMPIEIQVPRGDASNALYEQRLAALRQHLVADGIDPTLVTFADGKMPGGDGISSDRVNLLAVEEQRNRQQTQGSSRRGGTDSSGSGSMGGSGGGNDRSTGGSGSRSGGGGY
jgi:hypothetical protein